MQNTMQIPESSRCEPAKYDYKKSWYSEAYDVLQSLRKDEILCDIKLKTDDGGVIFAHKVVLASASPYFLAMFTKKFTENNQDQVTISELDTSALQILIDFFYSEEISITEKNVQDLLAASNRLQVEELKEACCHFLQAQICLTNCIDIFALADIHRCTELVSSTELYIQQHFSDVVEGDKFLSLSSEQITKLIASEELKVPSEKKVFESVIRWVNYDLYSRRQFFPQLMAHVRLPLISKDYILKHVVSEPVFKNCPKCNDYLNEALHFHSLKSDEIITMSDNIRIKPRQPSGTHKVIIVVGGEGIDGILKSIEWYDPKINDWQLGPKMSRPRTGGSLAVVKDNFVMYMGGCGMISSLGSAYLLDLSSKSPSWKPTTNMLVKRRYFGVGVINNYIYAVGGTDDDCLPIKSVEVFDWRSQKWRMVSSMSTGRSNVGVGVLNNLLYAVGGGDYGRTPLNSVECYHPGVNKWISVAEMKVRRRSMGVGVLDGVLYAVGGTDGLNVQKSGEVYRPSTGVWTTIPDMRFRRLSPGVAVLDGLLYVFGGFDGTSILNSVESYNPNTNTWTMITAKMNNARSSPGVAVIARPQYSKKWNLSFFPFYQLSMSIMILFLLLVLLYKSF